MMQEKLPSRLLSKLREEFQVGCSGDASEKLDAIFHEIDSLLEEAVYNLEDVQPLGCNDEGGVDRGYEEFTHAIKLLKKL